MNFIIVLAGLLSAFSPCVLPVLPILAASASRRSFGRTLILILGFLMSFVVLQILLSIVKDYVFLDLEWLRRLGAICMILMGAFMLFPSLNFFKVPKVVSRFAVRSGDSSFLEGLLLGIIWAPCIGPALGATLGLLASRSTRVHGSWEILLFGVGAALPLLLLSLGLQKVLRILTPARQHVLRFLHLLSALVFIGLGVAVLAHWDKRAEGWATTHLPDRWSEILSEY